MSQGIVLGQDDCSLFCEMEQAYGNSLHNEAVENILADVLTQD